MLLNPNNKAAVLAIKITEIDMRNYLSKADKEKLKNFYRKKLVMISPATKI